MLRGLQGGHPFVQVADVIADDSGMRQLDPSRSASGQATVRQPRVRDPEMFGGSPRVQVAFTGHAARRRINGFAAAPTNSVLTITSRIAEVVISGVATPLFSEDGSDRSSPSACTSRKCVDAELPLGLGVRGAIRPSVTEAVSAHLWLIVLCSRMRQILDRRHRCGPS